MSKREGLSIRTINLMVVAEVIMKLRMWYSILGTNDAALSVGDLLSALRPPVKGLTAAVGESSTEWQQGSLQLADGTPVVMFSRLKPGSEGFRARLDGMPEWIALFGDQPHRQTVLDAISRTTQIVNITPFTSSIGEGRLARICEQLSGFVSRTTVGVIQVYQKGFFSSEGESLLPQSAKHRLKTR